MGGASITIRVIQYHYFHNGLTQYTLPHLRKSQLYLQHVRRRTNAF